MKNILLAFSCLYMLISCNEDSDFKDYTEDNKLEIEAYLAENNLTADIDEYGLYYIIDEQGTGLQPDITSVVTLSYNAYFTDGTPIEETNENGVFLSLQQVLAGVGIGTTYFNEGGSGKLIIPSDLAYGNFDYEGIPRGSVLIYDINLLSVDFNKENDQEIQDYLSTKNLTDDAIKTDSGLYYIIEEEGTGNYPDSTSNVTVAYEGYSLNEVTFDESDDSGISFNLQQVIEGWQEGIPYFKEGGKGKLLIPSRLAYGSYGNSTIPGGAALIFDIELLSIN